MEASAIWKSGLSFEGTARSGFTIPMGTDPSVGGDDDGFRPMELILLGLAGCTGMDVVSILSKKKQELAGFEVRVEGQRAKEHPKVFTHIEIEYIVKGRKIDPVAVDRAIELSATKYCPVQNMLNKAVPIHFKKTIIEV